MKPIKTEIKENVQGTNSEEKETGTQINDLEEQKEEINIQSEPNEEKRIQKNEESPGWCSSVDWVQTAKQRIAGSIPSQGTCLGCELGPR